VKTEPKCLLDDLVTAIHNRQLAEHGGGTGLRDDGLLESALNAPKNKYHYKSSSIEELAACYAFSIAKNHPFVDGNKRTAYICMRLFLKLNGKDIEATAEEKIRLTLDLAAGVINQEEVTEWLMKHVV
jgi:death on curing protein